MSLRKLASFLLASLLLRLLTPLPKPLSRDGVLDSGRRGGEFDVEREWPGDSSAAGDFGRSEKYGDGAGAAESVETAASSGG